MARAHGARGVADLVLVVLDGSRPLEQEDRDLLAATEGAPRVVVVNKTDLWEALAAFAASGSFGGPRALGEGAVHVSLRTGAGLDELRAAIREALEMEAVPRDEPMVTNLRQETLLRAAHESIARALGGVEAAGEALNEELVLADLAAARQAFEEVAGKRTSEDVLRAIFARFCIGK